VPSVRKTSSLVQEVRAASEEQANGVAQINTAMSQLSQTTQQNASSSEELSAIAEEMSSQAEQLQQLMEYFKVDADSQAQRPREALASTRKEPPRGPRREAAPVPAQAAAEFVSF